MSSKKSSDPIINLPEILLSLILLLLCATYSYGAAPAGYSEYYIPGDEGDMYTVFNTLDALGLGNAMHSIITVTAWSDNTTIYYDHWENGYNFDPQNPSTADETYVLNKGQSMTFESGSINLPRTIGTPPATTCNNYRNRISVGSSTNCYDGGDHIYVAGGVVTVTRGSYIEGVGIGTQAVAWEIYPVKPQLTTYVLPFGENQGFWDFNRVFVLVQATEDNTTVTVDLNGDGTQDILNLNRDATWNNAGDGSTVTLQKGQTFLLDSVSACPSHANCTTAASNQLPAGAVIQANKTIQVKYIAGQPNQDCVARGFSAFPRGFWTKDYYAPLDQPTTAGRGNTDYYLYNPNSSAITINWESRTTSGSFSIPAGSTVSYRTAVGAVPVDSGLYFKGTDVFWGVGVGDAGNHLYEWGFSLLPSTMLFNEHFLGWAPDDNTTAANAAPSAPTVSTDMGVFLTVAQDNTTVFVDYDNNGTVDQTYTLSRLQTQYIVDPSDGDLTQAHIWATGPFTMAYGQNADTARTPGPPGGIDLGYVAIPGSDFISLVLTVDESVTPQVVPTASGSVATFTIKVDSQKYTIDGVNVTDYLPPNWQYLVGTDTATITWPDLTTHSADPSVSGVPATGQTLSWSSAQLGTNGSPGMNLNQEVTITFTARTTAVLAAGTLSQNSVKAVGTRTFGSPSQTQTFTATDFVYVTSGAVTITKTSSAADPVSPGDRFTYSVVVANPSTSGVTLTNLSLYDALPAGVTNVSGTTTVLRGDNVADAFGTPVYSNNNGTKNWAGNWTETDISGTLQSPTAGFVQVGGNGLQFGYQASNVHDDFSTAVYTRNDGNTNWAANWTENGDNNNATSGTINVNTTTAGMVDFTRCGTTGANVCNITRYVTVSGGSATISFLLANGSLAANEYLEADYSLNGGTTWVGMQRITTGGALSAPAGFCGNPCTISTAGATTLTVRFAETARWANGHHAQVNWVNIAFNDSVGSAAQRTANLTGATSASLNFTYAFANLAASDTVVVQASNAAAGPFTTLATFTAGTPDVAPPYNLTTYISANTTIRFLVTGGINAPAKTFSVDNVSITYNTPLAGANPPDLVSSSSAYNLTPGETLTASFDVTVNNPLATGIDTITNTASTTSTQFPLQLSASATNIVVNPSSGSAQVGDRVWMDANGNGIVDVGEPGLANIEVTLKDQFGTPIMTTATDATGHYLFAGVPAGNGYYVEATSATLPSGVQQSAPAGHTDNRSGAFNLIAGQSYLAADLGYQPSSGTAAIGSYVWSDANSNGMREAGEVGLAGVSVELWLDNGDKTFNSATDTKVATTTTAPDGSYLFTGVNASGTQDYFVRIDETQPILSGYTPRTAPSANPLFLQNVSSGDVDLFANFGYHGVTTYSIKDRIWKDANVNGIYDSATESGFPGVTVELLDASLNVIGTTTTAADGTFTFTGLSGGGADYTVRISDTTGVLQNYYGTTTYANALSRAESNLSVSVDHTSSTPFGSFGFWVSRSIGNTIFNDINGNGVQDSGDNGISGVVVSLYKDINGNGIIDLAAGPGTIAVTNGSPAVVGTGTSFLNYHAGEPITIAGVLYTILSVTDNTHLTLTANYAGTTASGLAYTGTPVGAGTVSVTNGLPAVVGAGTTFTNYRAGEPITIFGVPYTILSVTDNTHLTLTTNYAGTTNGARAYTGPGDAFLGSVTTDANGQYLFSGLVDRGYIVSVPIPSGYSFTGPGADSDGNAANGIQKAATITGGASVLTADFGFRATTPRAVSGIIWNDANANGIKDAGESGIAGVTIDILSGSTVVATVTTDATGSYSVTGLANVAYTVKVTDTSGVLTGYATTYEKTEGTTGPFNGQETVNLTVSNQIGVNFGYYSPAAPTLVVLSSFKAHELNGQVIVEWETTLENNTLGFYLQRLEAETGKYQSVTEGLLPGMLTSPNGGTYSLIDRGASPGGTYKYKLVEVEKSGNQIIYGPFSIVVGVGNAIGPQTLKSSAARSAGVNAFSSSDYTREPHGLSASEKARLQSRDSFERSVKNPNTKQAGSRIKIPITVNGLYYVDANDISSMLGITYAKASDMIKNNQLSMSSQGKTVAYLPAQANKGIFFYGVGTDNVYTRDNIYWIDKSKGTTMTYESGPKPVPAGVYQTFTDTLHLEQDVIPNLGQFTDPEADLWAWEGIYLSPAYSDLPKELSFQVNGKADIQGTAIMKVHLLGGSASDKSPDHHVVVNLNGQQIGEGLWSGLDAYTLTASFPQSLIAEGSNTLEVAGLLDAGVPWSYDLIDSFDLTWERTYTAAGDELVFSGDGNGTVTVTGFTSPDIFVFDIANQQMPKLNTSAVVTGTTGNWQVSLTPVSPGALYLAVAADSVTKVVNAEAVTQSNLQAKNNAADYIVIAPSELASTAKPLADYRTSQGLKTMVINVDDIMNEFNFGLSSPNAIRKFLLYAYSNWKKAPHYVVLAGEGTWDYRDNLGFGWNLIPPALVPSLYGLATSDNSLADINGDHLPEMAIGRLPALTPKELQNAINNIKTFEKTRGNRVILLADSPDGGGDFTAESEGLATLFSYYYKKEKIYLSEVSADTARTMLFSDLNNGAVFLNYIGHASPYQLSEQGVLTTDDLPLLTNGGGLPVMTAMTCSAGEFAIPGYSTLGSLLVLKDNGGAAAVWSSTGLSDDFEAKILNKEFYKAIFISGKRTLGDAVKQALAKYKLTGSLPFMTDIYGILGDPALKIR